MTTYQAKQQAPAWKDFDVAKGVLSNQLRDISRDAIVQASIAGVQTNTGDTVLKVNDNLYVKSKFFNIVPEPKPEPDDSPEPTPPPSEPPPDTGDLWQLLPSNGEGEPNPRKAAETLGSAPDIVVLRGSGEPVQLTKAWQLFLMALNPTMRPNNVAGLLGSNKAFTNSSGFPTPKRPQKRANYILGEALNYPYPYFDKVRSCAYACHQGVEANGIVTFVTLDGNEPPPMREGKSQPQSVADIRPDDYLYNPRDHKHLFFHATIVYRDGVIDPFPKGAPAWGYTRNVVLMPLVSTYAVSLPVSRIQHVGEYKLPYTR